MKPDITSREDVVVLVDTFYAKVTQNAVIGPIFTDEVKVDWSHHLPKMYSFWASIILNEQTYEGNPMLTHMQMSKTVTLGEEQFRQWLYLFATTVDELFEGPKATDAKARAANIARLMLHKVNMVSGK